jgi:excisionase family DNA binding protein
MGPSAHEHSVAYARRRGPTLPADAARIASVSRETIYREIDRGELRALHVGRQFRIDPDDFQHYLDREAQ